MNIFYPTSYCLSSKPCYSIKEDSSSGRPHTGGAITTIQTNSNWLGKKICKGRARFIVSNRVYYILNHNINSASIPTTRSVTSATRLLLLLLLLLLWHYRHLLNSHLNNRCDFHLYHQSKLPTSLICTASSCPTAPFTVYRIYWKPHFVFLTFRCPSTSPFVAYTVKQSLLSE